MEDLIVRRAEIGEIDVLLSFEQGIIRTERPFDPTLKPGEIHYYDLRKLVSSPDAEVLVAVSDGKIVGSGFADIRRADDYFKHERYAHFGFMYVEPAYRGRGVIQMILEGLKKWALAKGVGELRLEVYDANAAAVKAYEKAGFKRHVLKMRMEVSEEKF
ncbi:MAG TPA: GNAT family N-acetyltransferase [Pyrinomonadaceae bacterium]|jgi:GNAT superfamily N-acetyltransferase